jgi:hypothetical protein
MMRTDPDTAECDVVEVDLPSTMTDDDDSDNIPDIDGGADGDAEEDLCDDEEADDDEADGETAPVPNRRSLLSLAFPGSGVGAGAGTDRGVAAVAGDGEEGRESGGGPGALAGACLSDEGEGSGLLSEGGPSDGEGFSRRKEGAGAAVVGEKKVRCFFNFVCPCLSSLRCDVYCVF